MPLRLATLVAAQLFDVATFVTMVGARGLAAEANPVVLGMLRTFGLSGLLFAKAALLILVASLLVAGTARGRRGVWAAVAGLPLAVAIAMGLIGGITNAATLLG